MTVLLVGLCAFWTLGFEGSIVLLLVCLGLPWTLGAFLALPLSLAFALGTWGLLATKVRPWLTPAPRPDRLFESPLNDTTQHPIPKT